VFQRIQTVIGARSSGVEGLVVLGRGRVDGCWGFGAYISDGWGGIGTGTLEVGVGCKGAHCRGGGRRNVGGGVEMMEGVRGDATGAEVLDRVCV
jgi:hypothetical protein